MTEEERAAAYRQEQLDRMAAERQRLEGLSGDAEARASLAAAWRPLALASGPLVPVAPGMYVDTDDLRDDGVAGDMADVFDVLT